MVHRGARFPLSSSACVDVLELKPGETAE